MINSENIFVLIILLYGLVALLLNEKHKNEIKNLKRQIKKYQKR